MLLDTIPAIDVLGSCLSVPFTADDEELYEVLYMGDEEVYRLIEPSLRILDWECDNALNSKYVADDLANAAARFAAANFRPARRTRNPFERQLRRFLRGIAA